MSLCFSMKSNCTVMMVFINPPDFVLWNFPRVKSNTFVHSSQTPTRWYLSLQATCVSRFLWEVIALEGTWDYLIRSRTLALLRPTLTGWSSGWTVEWAVRKERLLANARPCFKLTPPQPPTRCGGAFSPGLGYILSDCWLGSLGPIPISLGLENIPEQGRCWTRAFLKFLVGET